MNIPRILLADDHSEMMTVVEQEAGKIASIVGVVHDGVALLHAAQALKPDLILLDIAMPRMNGFEAARQLFASMPDMRIIFLTVHDRPSYVAEAFRLGGMGYVLKRSAGELPDAIDRVMRGQRFLSSTLRSAHPEFLTTDSGN